MLATVHREGTVKLWKIETGAKAAEHAFGEDQGCGIRRGRSPRRDLWYDRRGQRVGWRQRRFAEQASVGTGRANGGMGPQGKELALIDDSGELWLYCLDSAEPPLRIAPDNGADRDRMVFSPDGATLAAASGLGRPDRNRESAQRRLWRTARQQGVLAGCRHLTMSLGSMVFSSGGDYSGCPHRLFHRQRAVQQRLGLAYRRGQLVRESAARRVRMLCRAEIVG